MKFENIKALKDDFVKGKIKSLPDEIFVDGVKYKMLNSTPYAFDEIIGEERKKPMVVFHLDRNEDNVKKFEERHKNADDEKSFQDNVVLVWAGTRMRVVPVEVKFVPKQRLGMVMVREANVPDEKIIGHKAPIILRGFNGNNPVKAKVDTGAAVCSLDANFIPGHEWKPGDETVTFEFGDRRVTMPCTSQAVSSADGGSEYRPVVKFDVELPNDDPTRDNRLLKGIQFNLNDRSHMPDKILLGQNFIKSGDFVVMNKSSQNKVIEGEVDWEALQEEFKDINIPEEIIEISDEQLIEELLVRLKK